jgi:DNA-binding MarR family transcriptional regulator
MKENGFFLPTQKYKELMILNYIEQNPDTTQKELGKAIGAAASMINTYIDEYESSGYVKREYITSKTVKYHITPKGLKRRNFLNISYLEQLMDLHKLAREGVELFLKTVSERGFKKILLYGAGEVAEIILGVIKFNSEVDINIVFVVDDDLEKRGKEILGYPIITSAEINKHEHDGIFISSYTFEDIIKQQLIKKGYDKSKIITFFTET